MIDEADVLNDLDQLRSRYDVLRQLGHDGACIVYGVRSRGSDRHFAVKMMGDPASRGAKAGALQVWQAHTVEQLDHPYVMVLHAVHHLQGGTVALAMERRRGRTLAELIDQAGPLSVGEAERILREIAEALAYLHGRGAIHRGVRPQSIFLDKDSGHARLAHFGIDRAVEGAGIAADHGAVLRTFAYLAPEQIDGQGSVDDRRLTVASDLYSLGLAGYAMLAGKQPWEGTSVDSLIEKLKTETLPPLAAVRADIPEYLCQAIEGCIERDPRRRWSSVEAFLGRLDPAVESRRAAPALNWGDLRVRMGSGIAAVRSDFGEKLSVTMRSKVALGVAGAVLGLFALGVLWGSGGPIAHNTEVQPPVPAATPEITSPEPRRLVGASADARVPDVVVRPRRSILDDLSTVPVGSPSQRSGGMGSTPAPDHPRYAPAAGNRLRRTAEPIRPGGLVLLGEPIRRQTPATILGDLVRAGNSRP